MSQKNKGYFSYAGFIPSFLKNYGLGATLRACYYFNYRRLKQPSLKEKTQQIVNANGYKISVIPDDPGISSELRIFRTHEPLTTELTLKELKKDMTCLDIGSNIGYYALLEAKAVGIDGKVIAIEPSPKNFEYLKQNIELGNIENIKPYNFAIGDRDSDIKFVISDRSNLCYVLSDDEPIPKSANVIKIPVKKIDTFVNEEKLEKIDFVRMDVEGYEVKLFEGMWNTLKKHKPLIQMEFHKGLLNPKVALDFLEKLKQTGYDVKYFIPKDIDRAIIGKIEDVKKYHKNIDDIIDMINKKSTCDVFILFLENRAGVETSIKEVTSLEHSDLIKGTKSF